MAANRSLKAIQGARRRRRKLEEEVSDLRQLLGRRLDEHDRRLVSMEQTLKALVDASNAVSVLVNCIEQFLDLESPGWDGGTRAEVELRAGRIKQRKAIYGRAAKSKSLDAAERVELGAELWQLAHTLGTEAQDVSMVISLYLQARAIPEARCVVGETRDRGVSLPDEVDALIKQLEERVVALER